MITKRRSRLNEENSKDRYLITYADLITLLLGLFVILYASSSIDEEKFNELKDAMSEVFKKAGNKVLVEGGDGVLDGTKAGIPDPVFVGLRTGNIDEIEKKMRGSLQLLLEKGKLNLTKEGNNLILDMPEELLFSKGKSKIRKNGSLVLDTISLILSSIPNRITVDGHTDIDPINTAEFRSNWHLSVSRALNVAYSMIESGLPESNLSIRGFGAQKPIAKNDNVSSKRLNRRVEITIEEFDRETPSTVGYINSDTLNQ